MERYDLVQEAAIVRRQISENLHPVEEARHLVSHAILAQVLLSLSDIGFYEWMRLNPCLIPEKIKADLRLDSAVFDSLLCYICGCGLVQKQPNGTYLATGKGEIFFNAYTRGVLNIYLGGYNPIFSQLTELLRGDKRLHQVARSTKHTAWGTALATCAYTIPEVFNVLKKHGARCILDLGCGAGDFLIQFLRLDGTHRAHGVDMCAEALAVAEKTAANFGVQDRVRFHPCEVGRAALPLSPADEREVDVVTAMYMIHELGREGREAVVRTLRELGTQFKGKNLLLLEVEAVEPAAPGSAPPPHFGRLDYRLIHELSSQGLPRSQAEWHSIFKECQFEILEGGIKTGGSYIFLVKM